MRQDFSRNLKIIVHETSVDGSEVGCVFVPGQVEPDFKDEFVYLGV